MNDSNDTEFLDIQTLVRRTGLTSRTLRFYESKGLVEPVRSHSGRRYYSPSELKKVHQIIVLKSAGLSLSKIKELLENQIVDFEALLNAQIKMLDNQEQQINRTRSVVQSVLSRITQSKPLDAETFCTLIESGDAMMNQEPKEWEEITDQYFSAQEKLEWAEKWAALPDDFDPDAYGKKWQDLGRRIKSALPLQPDSNQAKIFVNEWNILMQLMTSVFTPDMMKGVKHMYDDMDSWAGQGKGEADPGFDKEVWNFMQQAMAVHAPPGQTAAT